jgi:UDP-N-acetylglucosamine diphosphorylase/glucosamine-1-phosphate N-acetyltransferase
MRICLFEDAAVAHLEPLTLTRPVFHLLCGQTSLGAKQVRYFSPCTVGLLVRPYLAAGLRQEQPSTPVNDREWLAREPTILVNGRWLPPPGVAAGLSCPLVAVVGEEVAYAIVGCEQLAACTPENLDDCLQEWKKTLPVREAGGQLIHYLWDLVEAAGPQLELDFCQVRLGPTWRRCPDHVQVVGPREQVRVEASAQLEPLVVIDATAGPVIIDAQVVVQAFSRLEGPCYIGPGCRIHSARLRAGTILGPACRVGGEVEASILQGYCNKYHEGFLGHSYLGCWVNLGAGTQNSDLRNDYAPVTVLLKGQQVSTGRTKVGCFLGDHTKTAIGSLLNTGTVVGPFCNLVPAGPLLPKYFPPFTTWWKGSLREHELSAALATAERMMARRQVPLTPVQEELYRTLFTLTASERQRAFQESRRRYPPRAA